MLLTERVGRVIEERWHDERRQWVVWQRRIDGVKKERGRVTKERDGVV